MDYDETQSHPLVGLGILSVIFALVGVAIMAYVLLWSDLAFAQRLYTTVTAGFIVAATTVAAFQYFRGIDDDTPRWLYLHAAVDLLLAGSTFWFTLFSDAGLFVRVVAAGLSLWRLYDAYAQYSKAKHLEQAGGDPGFN